MSKHVLLIEDEPNIAEALRFILMRDGYAVSHVAEGLQAENAVRNLRPDAVILDVMLPGRSGYEVLAALRAAPDTADLPVLMLTARGQSRDRAEAARVGVSLFMTKPFSNAEILASVRSLVGA